MSQVPDKVLAWLYSVLQEYHDPQRTYSDVARALSAFPTLSPRTEVYTAEDGTSTLLLTLGGTLPVAFRGTTYRFPVKLWIPRTYAGEPPIAFVVPLRDMIIRPGQHVGVDGKVYHPYLRDWNQYRDHASITDLLAHFQQIFSKEPPVISKAQQQQYQQRPQHTSPRDGSTPVPPRPPPKPGQAASPAASSSNSQGPPPRPPKSESINAPSEVARDTLPSGPPLPPLPHQMPRSQHPISPPNVPQPFTHQSGYPGHTSQGTHHHHHHPHQAHQHPPAFSASPVNPAASGLPTRIHQDSPVSPISPVHGYTELSVHGPTPRPNQQPYQPPGVSIRQGVAPVQANGWHNAAGHAVPGQNIVGGVMQIAPMQAPQQQSYRPQAPLVPKEAPRDLLSDPFDVAISPMAHQNMGPAPPIPPNPEKEHLMEALSTSLVQQAQYKVSQNLAAVAPLQAQHEALLNARVRLKDEMRQLEQISQTIESNERILHAAINDCDRTISSAKSKPEPPIDEILLAPTLVAQQLWTLCAEEAAIREAMYVLQKAVDRGRISGEVFVKQMRGLGREAFLKMALARKCASGMGLEMHN